MLYLKMLARTWSFSGLGVVVLFGALSSSAALGDTINVPADFETIQEAINAAQVDGDEILVGPGTYNERINFSGKNLTLRSQYGAPATIIDPQGEGGFVVVIDTGETAAVIEGFTIRNGLDSAVYVSAATATLTNCRLIGNTASEGAAIRVQSEGVIVVTGCDISDNAATSQGQHGGVIRLNDATATFTNCTIERNSWLVDWSCHGNSGFESWGGAVSMNDSALTCVGCTFTDNLLQWKIWWNARAYPNGTGSRYNQPHGGDIGARSNSSVDLQGCSFDGSQVVALGDLCNQGSSDDVDFRPYARGGSIGCDSSSSVTATSCTWSDCIAHSESWANHDDEGYPSVWGGAIFSYGTAQFTDCDWANCTVELIRNGNGNAEQAEGGAITFENNPTPPQLTNCSFTNNSCRDEGGAIDVGTATDLVLANCTFTSNSANYSGAVHFESAATATISDCTFIENNAINESGGAMFFTGGTRTLSNCTFSGNTALRNGGALYANNSAVISAQNCSFNDHTATDGGALALTGSSKGIYDGCSFSGNTASSRGGDVWDYDEVDSSYTDCLFSGASALTSGGSVYLYRADSAWTRCMFTDVSTEGEGGAFYMNDSRPTILYCTVDGASSYNAGGAFSINGASEPYFLATAFRNCSAENNNGGAHYSSDSTPYILGCTFENTTVDPGLGYTGGAIYTSGSGTNLPFVVNSSFCGAGDEPIGGSGILGGTGNVVAESCADDCNNNNVNDLEDILNGTSLDVDNNGIPDECQTDCNDNGVPDQYEFTTGNALDCNGNGVPDACDISSGISADMDENDVPDECEGETNRLVPFDYPTIQAAINAAVDGDEVVVAPGAYYEKINYGGRNIHIRSVAGHDVTFIDGNGQNGSLVVFDNDEGPGAILQGITLWYGQGGHANYIVNASPTIRDCVFRFNSHNEGAAMRINGPNAAPSIETCDFIENYSNNGGAIYIDDSKPAFTNCRFEQNSVGGYGGAVWCRYDDCEATFVDCGFSQNDASGGGDHRGGAVYGSDYATATFTDCEFSDNWVRTSGNSYARGGATCFFSARQEHLRSEFVGNRALTTSDGGWGRAGAVYDDAAPNYPRYTDCLFNNNEAGDPDDESGYARGGAYYAYNCDPRFNNCTMEFNSTIGSGQQRGGTFAFEYNANADLVGCSISGSFASQGGAIASMDNAQPFLYQCDFTSNEALESGGAIWTENSPVLTLDCSFGENLSPDGAAFATTNNGTTNPTVSNSSFCGHVGAIFSGDVDQFDNTERPVCYRDCDGDDVDDYDEILAGDEDDCDGDWVIDACAVADGTAADIDSNGVPDTCQACMDSTDDCDENGIPDLCELENDASADCDMDGTLDACQIAADPSLDIDSDGTLDVCEPPHTRSVPSEYLTISAAVNAAVDGDTVRVAPGTYNESISFGSASITLLSSGGSESTIIEGAGLSMPLLAITDANVTITIDGFTLRDGGGTTGGGIVVAGATVTVTACSIEGCVVSGEGGGAWLSEAAVTFDTCSFLGNEAGTDGGAIYAINGVVSLIDCTVEDNQAAGSGGAVFWSVESPPATPMLSVSGTVFSLNYAGVSGGGLLLPDDVSFTAIGTSTVCNNTPDNVVGEFTDNGGNDICTCLGDLNRDGEVRGADLATVLAAWGSCGECEADLNSDGVVDGSDLSTLLGAWGTCGGGG